jgi:hypothetical protein
MSRLEARSLDVDAAVQRLLDRLGDALTRGDATQAAACWQVPALVLSDEGSLAIDDIAAIVAFFESSIPWYREQGVVTVRPDLLHVDPLSGRLAAVDVRWPGFDAEGGEVWSETSHYVLSLEDDGDYRVRVALTRKS